MFANEYEHFFHWQHENVVQGCTRRGVLVINDQGPSLPARLRDGAGTAS